MTSNQIYEVSECDTKTYFVLPKTDNVITSKLFLKRSTIDFECKELYDHMCKVKGEIDLGENSKYWDKAKRKMNPYEMIHVNGTNCLNEEQGYVENNPDVYSPLSRAFFKMMEIYDECDIIPDSNKNVSGKVACLAEGPGGFMEAIFKKRYLREKKQDFIHSITLGPRNNKSVPGWSQLMRRKTHPVHHKNVFLHTGNLYKYNTLKLYQENFLDDLAYLVTGDGGFDYSHDFNNQEKSSFQIIFAEITTCLLVQKKGGTFICKLFDLFTYFSIQLMYLLTTLYDEVILFKPKTSRPANSEKYVIAKGFKGIHPVLLGSMIHIVKNWVRFTEEKKICVRVKTDISQSLTPTSTLSRPMSWSRTSSFSLLDDKDTWETVKYGKPKTKKTYLNLTGLVFENIKVPELFIEEMKKINHVFAQRQEKFIRSTLDYIQSPHMKNSEKCEQNEYAIKWFNTYHIMTKDDVRNSVKKIETLADIINSSQEINIKRNEDHNNEGDWLIAPLGEDSE